MNNAARPVLRLTVYGRPACHLCDELVAQLRAECGDRPTDLQIVDVDTDPGLAARYGPRVPVLLLDGRELCHYRLDLQALRRALV